MVSRLLQGLIRAAAGCVLAIATAGPARVHAQAADGLQAAIARIKPALVAVGGFSELGNPRFGLRGTGFVVADGNVVATNAHVVQTNADDGEGAALAIIVHPGQPDAQMRKATLLDLDKAHDLALLRFEGAALTPVSLGDSEAVTEGQSIAFMGFPIGASLGFSPVTHRGIVSSITPMVLPPPNAATLDASAVTRLRDKSFRIFQLDATAYPGNSGGPLFDADSGKVLGLVNMAAIKSTKESALAHPSGISYAIPARFLTQLLDKQKPR